MANPPPLGAPDATACRPCRPRCSIFDVAIDVNTNSQRSETLQSFEVLVNGIPQYVYNGPTNIGSIDNNGNGFADWLLSRIDLSRFNATDLVLFHAVWTFFKVQGKADNEEVVTFYKDNKKGIIHGKTLTLKSVVDGNVLTPQIDRAEFENN